MEYKFKTKFQYRSIMDMVPLIDFSFSMLIFFMMTYNADPGKVSSIIVNLPKAVQVAASKSSDIVISVNAKNEVYINDVKYDLNRVLNELKKRKQSLTQGTVIIRGDRLSNYETIVKVMDYLNQAGLPKFTLSTVKSGR
jgi:biopolymer transport protein ExbD